MPKPKNDETNPIPRNPMATRSLRYSGDTPEPAGWLSPSGLARSGSVKTRERNRCQPRHSRTAPTRAHSEPSRHLIPYDERCRLLLLT